MLADQDPHSHGSNGRRHRRHRRCSGHRRHARATAADEASPSGTDTPAAAEDITTLRLGYFPNFTHAPALVGIQQGFFKDALGELEPHGHADGLQRRP